jgi:hypothetical protein
VHAVPVPGAVLDDVDGRDHPPDEVADGRCSPGSAPAAPGGRAPARSSP